MFRSTFLTTVAVLAISAVTFAAPARARATWASGQLEKYDPSARTVVIKQGARDMTFVLASDAHLMQGKTTLQASDLTSDVGRRVKVRYSTSGSTMTADRVEVTPAAAQAKAATKGAAKKS